MEDLSVTPCALAHRSVGHSWEAGATGRGWGLGHCGAVSFQKHCDRQKANLRIRFKPSLFQHVGTHSSLAGKIQKLKVGTSSLSKLQVAWPAGTQELAAFGWGHQ